MSCRRYLNKIFRGMKIGDCVRIEESIFREAYPCGWPSMYRTPEQAFLSSMIGSAWGVWRVRFDYESRSYIVSKYQGSETKRYYVDPDRECLFKKELDGSLVRR